MNCTICAQRLRIIQVIGVGSAKVQLAECSKCCKRFTTLSFVFAEAKHGKHGSGIKAVAKKLRAKIERGGLKIDL